MADAQGMNGGVALGPLVIPYGLLLVVGVATVAMYVGQRVGKKLGVDAEPALWSVLLVALAVARLGFVFEFRSAYLEAPLSILDIRDGGWSPVAGFVGAWLFAIRKAVVSPTLKKPLHWSLWTGTSLWLVGSMALAIQPVTGIRLPSLALATLDGSPIALDTFVGKPTVVNLWATWCPPCNREMPLLHQAQVSHPSVNFVFLNQGESPERVNAWLSQQHLALGNVILDSRLKAGALFGSKAYPTTLFFDGRGNLVATRLGELSLATLTEKLDLLNR